DTNVDLARLDRETLGAEPLANVVLVGPRLPHQLTRRVEHARQDNLAIEGPLTASCVHASSPSLVCAASLVSEHPSDRSALPKHLWCARPTRPPRPNSRPASCTGGAGRLCRA